MEKGLIRLIGINRILLKLFLTFFLIPVIFLLGQNSGSDNEILSPLNLYKFGNYLFKQGDYLRANNELKQYLQYENNDTVRFKIAYSLIEMAEYSEGRDYLKPLFISSEISDEVKCFYFKSLYLGKKYSDFIEQSGIRIFQPTNYSEDINRLKNFFILESETTLIDSTNFFKPFDKQDADSIRKYFVRKYYPENKSETTAGLLSALIPGAGKIYTGQTGDGITSLIFNSVIYYLVYNNFANKHYLRGWIFSALGIYFNAGNIYGSVASARIYNSNLQINLGIDMKKFVEKKNYFMPDMSGILK